MKIDSHKIKSALRNLRPILSTRPIQPVLSNVLLKTGPKSLEITASNLDEYATEHVEASDKINPVCVPFNYLDAAIIGGEVEIKNDGKHLVVQSGDNITKLPTLSDEQFPAWPKTDKLRKQGVPCDALSAAIKSVSWASSTDPGRYVINSVSVECSKNTLTCVSTDGHQLAKNEAKVIASDFNALITGSFSDNLCLWLARPGAVLSLDEKNIQIEHESGRYCCKQHDGRFPNYRQVIPTDGNPIGKIKPAEALQTLKGMVCFADKVCVGVKMVFNESHLELSMASNSGGDVKRLIPGKFKPFTVSLDIFKAIKIMQSCTSEFADLEGKDELSPVVVTDQDLMIVTMPMRLK